MTVAVAEATAARHAAGVRQSVSTPTNDTAEAVNELVRDRLIAAGLVDALHRDRSDIGLVQATSDAAGEAARYGRGSELSFADRMAAALTPHTHTRRAEEQTVTVDHGPPAAARHIGRGARL